MINTFVFDTNVLISAHLLPRSVSRQAFDLANNRGLLVHSEETIRELVRVFSYPKFDRYQPLVERMKMVSVLEQKSQLIKIVDKVKACRDESDDMFLELALSSKASAIITGDPDLKVLNPFRDIMILSPAEFLQFF